MKVGHEEFINLVRGERIHSRYKIFRRAGYGVATLCGSGCCGLAKRNRGSARRILLYAVATASSETNCMYTRVKLVPRRPRKIGLKSRAELET